MPRCVARNGARSRRAGPESGAIVPIVPGRPRSARRSSPGTAAASPWYLTVTELATLAAMTARGIRRSCAAGRLEAWTVAHGAVADLRDPAHGRRRLDPRPRAPSDDRRDPRGRRRLGWQGRGSGAVSSRPLAGRWPAAELVQHRVQHRICCAVTRQVARSQVVSRSPQASWEAR